jgi:hypothetical protein
MILGNGWKFLRIYDHRTVNVIGFDKKHAHRSGCPIGSAYSVMTDSDGKEFIAVAHEAVWNKGSNTSLLSEFQMREHGLIVDSTSKKHKNRDGSFGTQQIYIPNNDISIPLYLTSGLMTSPHREPTDEELATLPKVELTSPDIWNPRDHIHDDAIIVPLTKNDTAAYQDDVRVLTVSRGDYNSEEKTIPEDNKILKRSNSEDNENLDDKIPESKKDNSKRDDTDDDEDELPDLYIGEASGSEDEVPRPRKVHRASQSVFKKMRENYLEEREYRLRKRRQGKKWFDKIWSKARKYDDMKNLARNMEDSDSDDSIDQQHGIDS